MDAIDVAYVETDGADHVQPGPARSFPYAAEDRALLRAAIGEAAMLAPDPAERNARPGALAAAQSMVTARHAEAVEFFPRSREIAGRGHHRLSRPDCDPPAG